jgi:hypothetical protein
MYMGKLGLNQIESNLKAGWRIVKPGKDIGRVN